jgi:hypothetical protein
MESGKNFVLGIFDDEDVLLKAVKQVRKEGVNIHEVFSPFPVHGLDDALGYKRSRLPIAAFLFGLTGTSLALLMQYFMLGIDWPMIIGGKDHTPLPTFIPVTFELTVLLASLGMVAVFLISSNLKPHGKPKIFDIRSTDDKHVLAVDLAKNAITEDEIKSILKKTGASEVNNKSFE